MTDHGHSVAQVARDLDLDAKLVSRWKRELDDTPGEAFPGKGRLRPQDEELRSLHREVHRLRQERDILKKAVAIFSTEAR